MGRSFYYPAYPDGKLKMFTVSYDDGNDCDAILVEMLRRHGAKGTFNLNSGLIGDDEVQMPEDKEKRWKRMTVEEALEVYGDDMEIAVHGSQHPWWDKLSPVNAMADILDDRRALERATGRIIRGAAYPWGTYSKDVIEILRQAGFAYCRALNTTKKLKAMPKDPLCYEGTVRHREPQVLDIAKRFAADACTDGRPLAFYLWGHTYEFMQYDNWHIMEEILSIVGDREDVWYATNLEYFDYMAAAQKLRYNVDRTVVENPTSTDIWLRRASKYNDPDATFAVVPAGGSLKLD